MSLQTEKTLENTQSYPIILYVFNNTINPIQCVDLKPNGANFFPNLHAQHINESGSQATVIAPNEFLCFTAPNTNQELCWVTWTETIKNIKGKYNSYEFVVQCCNTSNQAGGSELCGLQSYSRLTPFGHFTFNIGKENIASWQNPESNPKSGRPHSPKRPSKNPAQSVPIEIIGWLANNGRTGEG